MQAAPQRQFFYAFVMILAGISTLTHGEPAFKPAGEATITDIHPTDVIHWQGAGAESFKDHTIEVGLRLWTEQEFTLYQDKVSFKGPEGFELRTVKTPPTERLVDPISGAEVEVFTGGDFMMLFAGLEAFKGDEFPVAVTFLGCTSRICLFPFTQTIHIKLFPSTRAASTLATAPPDDKPAVGAVGSLTMEERLAGVLAQDGLSLLMLVAIAMLGGLLTNLTPCVAPMIPITVRLLANQKFSPLVNSSLYASGILVTYTTLGVAATLSGGAFGTLMASVTLNLAFALLMAFLGLTMLGYGNLTFLQTIGSRIGGGKPSAANTFMMGAAAGLVAAPCTGPILGALLAFTAANQNPQQGVVLMFFYSLGFSLPYVFLGGAAARAARLRVSPFLQLLTKVVFAGVMFGLAFYYLRIPAYQAVQQLRGHWSPVAVAALSAGVGLTVLWLLVPALQRVKAVSVLPALFLGLGLFAGSQWLTNADPALAGTFKVYKTEAEAFAAAKAAGKPILIDNWAEWCEACKKMDITTFVDPVVIAELEKNWVVAKLDLTEGNETHEAHMTKYGINGLPTLTLLPADGDVEKKHNIIGYVSAAGLLNQLHLFREK